MQDFIKTIKVDGKDLTLLTQYDPRSPSIEFVKFLSIPHKHTIE